MEKRKSAKMRFESALSQAAGAWSDKNHPELKTKKDVGKYLRDLRKSWDKRLKKIYI